jgi:hypothetical protein
VPTRSSRICEVTGAAGIGREGGDERMFRFGLRFNF